ncbi:DUF6643 family protein [Streptomyces sp. NPDC057555]|uniref:DUF6643 family protein n=1 Tax=Streptomyces sp. NPDC057555 TaxID=3346166 RepID=UPI0036864BCD
MTSPRSTYSGGYYASPSFPDTPIYDSLVAERGTPQIAPIRVNPSPWDLGSPSLPALPSALPALPAASSPPPSGGGYPGAAAQPVAPLQHTPAPSIPQQAGTRGYQPPQQPQRLAPGAGTGYEAMRPVAPRPASPFDDQGYGRQYPRGY